MKSPIAIIMPAYRAEATIVAAAQSLLNQTFGHWQLFIVCDDGADYQSVLGRAGLSDPRFTFLSSGKERSGASRTRNVALDAADCDFAAILDADDRFKPEKLARAAAALGRHAIVSTGLDVVDHEFEHLRYVGLGPDRFLAAGDHKRVNFSMDSMIVWDRRRTDARYDPDLPNMTDLEFLMKLWRTAPGNYHLGQPLHDYVKLPSSMSNGAGVTERMIAAKTLLLARLAEGYYPMADERARAGLEAFLHISLAAERAYPLKLAEQPGALFEDTIEPLLRAEPR